MIAPPKGKAQPLLRWTIGIAATEFGIHRATLTKRLRQADAEPEEDGRYSTRQIIAAIFNDSRSERTRLYAEQADKLALENAKARSEQVEMEAVYKTYEGIFTAMRKTILASALTDAEKSEALAQLRHDTDPAVPA